MRQLHKYLGLGIILILLLAADWGSKYCFEQLLDVGQSLSVIGDGFLQWTLYYNTGFSFSIGASYPVLMRWLVGGFAIVVGCFFLYYVASAKDKGMSLVANLDLYGMFLLASGALGNGCERLLNGYVTDFIHFRFFGKDFAVFNVADIWINVGVFCIILSLVISMFAKKPATPNT